jgi:hypothetical protein
MLLLQYKDLNLRRVKAAFDKVKAAIEADDFRSADVKKLHAGPYYRAKLDYANRRCCSSRASNARRVRRPCAWRWR